MSSVLPVVFGALTGGRTGTVGRSRTGACPLTSRWWAVALSVSLPGYLPAAP